MYHKYELELDRIYNIYSTILNNFVVQWLCEHSPIPVEVYGRGWDKNYVVAPYWKGDVEQVSEVARVYNSATYALDCQRGGLHTQRLAELTACGCIPVVYDNRAVLQEDAHKWDDEILFFSTPETLKEQLIQHPDADWYAIGVDMSYDRFAKRIVDAVNALLDS